MNREEFISKWEYSPECGDGWLHLIDAVLANVKAYDPQFQIRQIKEKFGGLRIYLNTTYEMYPMMNVVESISTRTCEITGKPGKLVSKGGWYRTRAEGIE